MGIDVDHVDPAAFPEDVEMRVGEVTGAEPSPEAETDLYGLEADFGRVTRLSAAGSQRHDDPLDLVGRQILAVDLGTVSIAGFESRCLVIGVDDGEGGVVHLQSGIDRRPGVVNGSGVQ